MRLSRFIPERLRLIPERLRRGAGVAASHASPRSRHASPRSREAATPTPAEDAATPAPAELAPHLALGRRGEELAAAHLRRAGYRLVASNFKLNVGRNRRGALVRAEIDIVAYDGATREISSSTGRIRGDSAMMFGALPRSS